MSVVRILADTFRVLPGVPPGLIGIVFGLSLAYTAVSGVAVLSAPPASIGQASNFSFLSLVGILVFGSVVLPFVEAATIHSMGRRHLKKPTTLTESLRAGVRALPSMIGASLILLISFFGLGFMAGFVGTLGVVVGGVASIVGLIVAIAVLVLAVVLGVGLSLFPAAIVANHESATSSLGASWQHTKGNRIMLFIAFLVLGIPLVLATVGVFFAAILLMLPVVTIILFGALFAGGLLLQSAMIAVAWNMLGPPLTA